MPGSESAPASSSQTIAGWNAFSRERILENRKNLERTPEEINKEANLLKEQEKAKREATPPPSVTLNEKFYQTSAKLEEWVKAGKRNVTKTERTQHQ